MATVIARLLAGSVVVMWPALLIVDGLPSDGALNGKADDFVTGGISALLIVGLLAAGWLKPLRVVLVAVLSIGFGAPILYEALHPTVCPVGGGGMDCIPVFFNAVLALPGVLLVLAGSVVRRGCGVADHRAAAPVGGRRRLTAASRSPDGTAYFSAGPLVRVSMHEL